VNRNARYPAVIFSVILILAFIFAIVCTKSTINPVEKSFVLMDTYVTIRVYDQDKSPGNVSQAINKAMRRMIEIDSLTTIYADFSEVIRINENAGKSSLIINRDVANIISQAQQVSELSTGAFDISVQPLMQLWGFGHTEHMRVPAKDSISALLAHVDYHKISLAGQSIQITDPLAAIDLGGIAKGYAVDVAVETLAKEDISDAQVDAGGNLRTLASALTTGRRNIYVRHPRQHENFYGRFPMDVGAVATSGDYERFFFQDSIRYHHILDPTTGFPARRCVSATIVAPTAMLCDALSTAVFVLGLEKGIDLIERLPKVEGLIIYEKDGKLAHVLSSGLKGKFELAPKK
jgi:thiamine biosynthesis lipoprotein